jgi:hypothetical protein
MKSSKRCRPLDEDVALRIASLHLRRSKTPRAFPIDEVVPETDDEIVPETDSEPDQEVARPIRTWVPIKRRPRDAFGFLRTLLFIHSQDERVCLGLREFLQFNHRAVKWLALLRSKIPHERSLPTLLQYLDGCTPKSKTEELNPRALQLALSALGLTSLWRHNGVSTATRESVRKRPIDNGKSFRGRLQARAGVRRSLG